MDNDKLIPALMSHKEMCEVVGARVRSCREHFGLSRRELAEKSGVSVPTISRLELDGIATISVLIKLAMALGVTETLNGIFETPGYKTMEEFIKAGK